MKKIALVLLFFFVLGCSKDDKAEVIPTITNGTQFWQNTNLNVSTYSDGTVIPEITDPTEWIKLTTGAWCYYNNDPANGATYGKLYNWYAVAGIWNEASKTDASQRKKLAPTGYHIPSDAEWMILISYLGGETVAGGAMKEVGNTHWQQPNYWETIAIATNSSGFTGLPGGYRYTNQGPICGFGSLGEYGHWWSSSEYVYSSESFSYIRRLDTKTNGLVQFVYRKNSGFSVRCLRD